ncbi:hypothetical protein [Ensifer aridi]|uniref:hypothetical protein n=1 Tax=Ensifer aridi TaxID=1708715 RepID=UPI000A101A67|nr:hypothetical protein [Ensifer aridi]
MENAKPTIYWTTERDNGRPTIVVTFSPMSPETRSVIEHDADQHGFIRRDNRWTPPEGRTSLDFFEIMRAKGIAIEFEREPDGPVNLQRLALEPETREKLVALQEFQLDELAGYCPVQAEGLLDGQSWYFRARGAYWRFELGGNENRTKSPTWWHEENWPSADGFAAGYLTDEEAISCILKAVNTYRTEDRSRFEPGHPDYERTCLEGWSAGALSLQRIVKRFGITGEQAIERAKGYGIEIPYTAEIELKNLDGRSTVHGIDRKTGEWVEIRDEDE